MTRPYAECHECGRRIGALAFRCEACELEQRRRRLAGVLGAEYGPAILWRETAAELEAGAELCYPDRWAPDGAPALVLVLTAGAGVACRLEDRGLYAGELEAERAERWRAIAPALRRELER